MLTLNRALDACLETGDITHASEYAEPGYTAPAKGILFANWNEQSRYVNGERVVTSRVLARMGEFAEKAGYTIEWSDEWATCDDCSKAVRTSPDSYGWQPAYWLKDGCEILCRECVLADPDDHLEFLSGNASAALQLPIDLAEYGYTRVDETYENGWYPGQTDEPETIATRLRADGVTDFIFQINAVGQFDVRFCVWVKRPAPEPTEALDNDDDETATV